MNIKQLIDDLSKIMENHGENLKVCIPVKNSKLLGPSPSCMVKGVMVGFDWDKGKVFIHPQEDLIIKPSESSE